MPFPDLKKTKFSGRGHCPFPRPYPIQRFVPPNLELARKTILETEDL